MSEQHSKEPWYVGKANFSAIPIFSKTDDEFPVASTSANTTPKGMQRYRDGETLANAERIVACVNACAGADDSILNTLNATGGLGAFWKEVEKLNTERDQLLAALIRLKSAEKAPRSEWVAALKNADEVIAKAKP